MSTRMIVIYILCRCRSPLVLACLAALFAAAAPAQRRALTIGITIDGPWERNDEVRKEMETEIVAVLKSEWDVSFPESKRLEGDWTAESVKENIDRLIADPEVDVVLALGILGSNDAARRRPPKLILAPYVLYPDVQGSPYVERTAVQPGVGRPRRFHVSGVENLSYTAVGTDFLRDVTAFRKVVPFTNITILTLRAALEGVPELRGYFARVLAPLKLDVTIVDVGGSLDEALARIPDGAEAVYVAPMLQLPPGEFERLTRALIDRKLPSFSLWGRSEVERGLLASLALARDFQRIARRTALNLHRVMLGESAADLPVDFDQSERLAINMATARAIGVYPTWAVLTEAELLNQPRESAARTVSLASAVREAERVNLDLAAADRTLSAGLQQIEEARGVLRPQVDASGRQVMIDKDRAKASFGSMGRFQTAGSLDVTQIIYSEQARANLDVERQLQDSRTEDRAQLRLDVVLEAAQNYLNVLRTKTAERIQRENLELTRQNLERARSRLELGASGPGEVYRWEAEIANNRKDVIASSAQRNQAEIALNRVLNRPSEESFLTADADLTDPELGLNYEALRPYINNPEGFRIFRTFVSGRAIDAAPELRQLDAAIHAQERVLLARKRVFYTPTVAVQGSMTGFKNAGAGASPPMLPEEVGFQFPLPNNLDWSLAVNASLPLFSGGTMRAERAQAEIELDELTVRREAARLRVEQRIRSALHEAMSSWAAIDLSRDAATAAKNNLDLVQDAYSEGVVDIIRLLDAQNQALVADLLAANAVYDFLLDLMSVQRAVGEFGYFRSPEDREKFLSGMRQYFKEEGYEPREIRP